MSRTSNERFIIFIVSLSCLGLTFESILLGWEFWVPPIIIIGTVGLWIMHITERPETSVREAYYLIYAMFVLFFHGIHETSFFDVSVTVSMGLVAYSLLNHIYMMNMLLGEYIVIMLIQTVLATSNERFSFDTEEISRLMLHVALVWIIYLSCTRVIRVRSEEIELQRIKDAKIEAYDTDMEDFLSNISHELRTPVNVVNGMSDLLIKKNVGSEPYSIKDAGIRLSYQIEDIQDYSECKRGKVILEEDDYTITSLINDVVVGFRSLDNNKNLDLVVDLDPLSPLMLRGDIKKLHKIFRHLLSNAVKFTRKGGIYVKLATEDTESGLNLCIEMIDTGMGMSRQALASVSEGMYQANKKRNRSSGGIGLGLAIVYGFAHCMGGFVKIESEKNIGTTVRVTIPQTIVDSSPCLTLSDNYDGIILFHVKANKYKVPMLRDFYRKMAIDVAMGTNAQLYSAETINEIERFRYKLNVKHIFMGQDEYEDNPEYFDELSKGEVVVAVSANPGFKVNPGSRVMVMPKPLYAYPVIKILNEGRDAKDIEYYENTVRPSFVDVKSLVVDDEPMNLVVATGLFNDYNIEVDTAESGKESIMKFARNDYDVVFMDHMMPEMDGVEAMKRIKAVAKEMGKEVVIIALTANAVSGAREMFMKEGFDGFIAKPINRAEFERVMTRVLPDSKLA